MNGFRVALSVVLFCVHAWMWCAASRAEDVRSLHAWSIALAAPLLVFIATDVDRPHMTARVASAWRAPWISGHHRGALYFALHVAATTASAVLCARRFEDGVAWVGGTVAMQSVLVALLLCAWTLLPIGLLGAWIDEGRRRIAACTIVLAFVLLLTAIGFALEPRWSGLTLFSIVEDVINQGDARGRLTANAVAAAWTLGVLAAVGAALCLPRALLGVREVSRRAAAPSELAPATGRASLGSAD